MKNKVKQIVKVAKDHKKEILIGSGLVIIGGIVGFGIGHRVGFDTLMISFDNAISDGKKAVEGCSNIYTGIFKDPVDIDDLGKLGEFITDDKLTGHETFTHFIALGETVDVIDF